MRSAMIVGYVLCAALLSGCATSSVSSLPAISKSSEPVKVIALGSGGGMLADAVGVELSNRGFSVIDVSAMTQMMVRLNLNEIEVSQPQGLAKLKSQGIDAYLVVRSAGGYDGLPQSASARVNSTATGQVIAGVSWQNGWGGEAGSIADRTMRQGLTGAAEEITNSLEKSLR
jgi:hypothetical protein